MTQVSIEVSKRKTKNGYNTFDGWEAVDLPADMTDDNIKRLNIINKMLSKQRDFARDHEHDHECGHSGEMFHGAALIKTQSGRYYMAANIHLHNSKLTRNCAEAMATTDAANNEGRDMEITDVWFMGGKGDMSKSMKILPSDFGRRNSPCGSCLDVIWNNRIRSKLPANVGKETMIHMLPLNDGEWKIMPDDGRSVDYDHNQVVTRSITQLLPHVTVTKHDHKGDLKAAITKGWDLINEPMTGRAFSAAMSSKALSKINKISGKVGGEELVSEINGLMVDELRRLHSRSHAPLKAARVAVVRLDNGEFYMGVSLENGVTTAMGSAEAEAIQCANIAHPTGNVVTDVFVMAVDFDKMPDQLIQWADKKADVVVKMPDGVTRDRMSKVSPSKGGFLDVMGKHIDGKSGARVHVILPNNKIDFDMKDHVITHTMEQLLPMRFISPKMDRAGHGESNTHDMPRLV